MVEEMVLVNALRKISLFIDSVGVIIGLDLIIGAPLVNFINKTLNKVIDIDKILSKPTMRVNLGLLFVIICGLLMTFALKARF
jgi:hypothetical protein